MRVVIATASLHGGTHEVGDWIADALAEEFGAAVDPVRLRCGQGPDLTDGPERVDAVVLGGATYAGRWPGSGRDFVRRHAALLTGVPVRAFSCGLGKPDRAPDLAQVAGVRIPVVEHRHFGGVVRLASLSTPERLALRAMGVGECDTRRRDDVHTWAVRIGAALVATCQPS